MSNAPYAAFGDYLAAAASRHGLADLDVAANVCDELDKSERGALSWWRHLRTGGRRQPLSAHERAVLGELFLLDPAELEEQIKEAGL